MLIVREDQTLSLFHLFVVLPHDYIIPVSLQNSKVEYNRHFNQHIVKYAAVPRCECTSSGFLKENYGHDTCLCVPLSVVTTLKTKLRFLGNQQ